MSRGISLSGFAYNLGLATLGNIIGGAIFVGGVYWIGSPAAREAAAKLAPKKSAVLASSDSSDVADLSLATQAG